ncbi:TauD/TfdA family dioxygenase [Vibrio amylolyticus]|uniref:TauD/TfdA family dioxygenase n=1 Tax=Vibrio amylolyticus TaxID=2847292 RepID=UPI00354F6595
MLNIGEISEQKKVNGRDFPLVVLPPNESVAANPVSMLDWFETNKSDIHSKLIEHGAVLLRGFPVESADRFEQLLDHSDYKNNPYIGGAAPRVQVTKSRVVTANEAPPSEKIPFHHEMAQTPKPPGYIFFYCDTPSKTGGATSILHSNEICQRFFELAPEFAKKIEEQGVRYIRYMPEVTDNASPIGRSWKETFNVETREECEDLLREHNMSWSWEDAGVLKTETSTLPAIRLDKETEQKTFFNSIVAVYDGWNDSRNVSTQAVVSGAGSLMDADVMEKTKQAMDELSVNFRWQKGDVLLVNNYTVLHARQPFTGQRRILASVAIKEQNE